jgi:hypothetical protein
MVCLHDASPVAAARFKVGICPASGFVEPPGTDIGFDAPVPRVGKVFLEPARESGKLLGAQLANGIL